MLQLLLFLQINSEIQQLERRRMMQLHSAVNIDPNSTKRSRIDSDEANESSGDQVAMH